MVVKKKSGKWQVCVDFMDLNKVCPKDPFPMPKIDQLVDATVGHHRKSFLDAFFLLINKWKGFEWTKECAIAFQQLKDYLAWPPIMSSPELDEVLFAYIAMAPYVVSLVLIRVNCGVQRPV